MTVRLYDTRTQSLRDFSPIDPHHVTMYVCGATVQSGPHLGHLRSALAYDVLARWLERRFGRVTFVRNVTDIDDKVLANATPNEPWWALAYRREREFTAAYAAIGIRPPTYEPRATGSIPQMLELIAGLVAGGHAYASGGDVYFDVRSWPAYGELTRQRIEEMAPAADADPRGKRDPRDFALWKATKPGEPQSASWETPWGPGRPGWHIECSAMIRNYLGAEFDIHGGGLDLRFPHHENELAQSTAAGDPFARFWVHNGLLTIGDQKMSKSLGNVVPAGDVLAAWDPLVVRYALLAAHYRSSLDIGESSFAEAEVAVDRIRGFQQRARRLLGDGPVLVAADLPAEFGTALDDDLAVPEALAVVHDRVRRGNAALDAGDLRAIATTFVETGRMIGLLGIDPSDPRWAVGEDAATTALDALVGALVDERARARADRDWAAADRVRDALVAAGVSVEDTVDGTHWTLARTGAARGGGGGAVEGTRPTGGSDGG